jgi:hypothetical protein
MGDDFWFEQFCFQIEVITIFEAGAILLFAKEHPGHSPREQQLQSSEPVRFF